MHAARPHKVGECVAGQPLEGEEAVTGGEGPGLDLSWAQTAVLGLGTTAGVIAFCIVLLVLALPYLISYFLALAGL